MESLQAQEFKKSLYAKCILAGEHAVLRGTSALVFPIKKYSIEMRFTPSAEAFQAQISGPYGEPLKFLFWGLLEIALKKVNKTRNDLKGKLEMVNYLPFGGGLGASAAISVGVGQLLANLGFVTKQDLFEFCRSLEDQFHGESSGADVAIAFYGSAIKYTRHQPAEVFTPKWQPYIYLYYTGLKGVTIECVNHVKQLQNTDPKLFKDLDAQMHLAVQTCMQALSLDHPDQGLPLLVEGLRQGQDCFQKWGLVPLEVEKAILKLKDFGAIQCKLTGSGGGGYLLGVWKDKPSFEIEKDLLALHF